MTMVTPDVHDDEVKFYDQREEEDGTIYSGQMKTEIQGGKEVLIKHGKGT